MITTHNSCYCYSVCIAFLTFCSIFPCLPNLFSLLKNVNNLCLSCVEVMLSVHVGSELYLSGVELCVSSNVCLSGVEVIFVLAVFCLSQVLNCDVCVSVQYLVVSTYNITSLQLLKDKAEWYNTTCLL